MASPRIPSSVGGRVLTGVILTGTLSVLDSTLVVPLLTTIGAEFGGGSEVSWLVAGYLLTSTVTIPLWGRWVDLRGERIVMWTALLVFLAGTLISMLAPTLMILTLGRLIQGVGAGGVVPVGQAILGARCTGAERARMQVYYNVAYGTAAGVGPIIGGALGALSWRWAFALVLPVILIAALLLRGRLTDRSREAESRRFDRWGSLHMIAGLTLILVGVERGWWLALGGGLLIIIVLVRHSLHRRDGLLPSSLLTSRTIVAAVVVGLLVGFVQFSMLTYLPLLSQAAAPEVNPGLVVVPMTVLWLTLGSVTGVLALRWGTRPLAVLGALLAAGSAAVVLQSDSYPSLVVASVLAGAAAGCVLIPLLLLCQRAAPGQDVGAATSLMALMRNFGGAAGAAVTAVVLADRGVAAAFGVLLAVSLAAVIPATALPAIRDGRQLERLRGDTMSP